MISGKTREVKNMSEINLSKIVSEFENQGVTEIDEKVGEWSFAIDELPVKLKIKVIKSNLGGKYMGIANYRIQNPDQATAYMSLRFCDTVEEALTDALSGFLFYWHPEKYKDETKFELVADW